MHRSTFVWELHHPPSCCQIAARIGKDWWHSSTENTCPPLTLEGFASAPVATLQSIVVGGLFFECAVTAGHNADRLYALQLGLQSQNQKGWLRSQAYNEVKIYCSVLPQLNWTGLFVALKCWLVIKLLLKQISSKFCTWGTFYIIATKYFYLFHCM